MTDRTTPEDLSDSAEPASAAAAAGSQPGALDERGGSVWATTAVIASLLAAVGTFLFLMGTLGVEPDDRTTLIFLGVDIALILALLLIVVRQLWRLHRANQAGLAGARLHRRVVSLFSLVAAVPTA
ncbi:MAG TPA: hypothetical protein PLE50_10300, partial [Rhabdaerophilum sp.]|nr:hypothetical protein [Rhabdaerophilum sp.]